MSSSQRFTPTWARAFALTAALAFAFACQTSVGLADSASVSSAALAGEPTPPTTDSHNQGGNFCLTQGHNIYRDANFSSPSGDYVSYTDVWHHYSTTGNWSLGYVKGSDPIERGYIPKGLFQYETFHDATRCH